MPKPDYTNENDPFGGIDINELKKTMEEMKKNGGLPAGIPLDIEGLFNQAKDVLKNVDKNPQTPAVGGGIRDMFRLSSRQAVRLFYWLRFLIQIWTRVKPSPGC